MLEFMDAVSYPPKVGRFNDQQLLDRSNWPITPDDDRAMAALHSIRIVPNGSTTVTTVNPLDPDGDYMWRDTPSADGGVVPAGRYC